MKMVVFTVQRIQSNLLPGANQASGGLRRWVSLYHTRKIFSCGQEKFWHFQVSGLLQEDVQQTFPLIPPGCEDTERDMNTAKSWSTVPATPKYCLRVGMTMGMAYAIVTNQVSSDKICPLGNRPVDYACYLRPVFLLLQWRKCL